MATLTRKSPAAAHKPFAHYSHVVTAQGANKLGSAPDRWRRIRQASFETGCLAAQTQNGHGKPEARACYGGAAERKIGQLSDELKRCQSPQA